MSGLPIATDGGRDRESAIAYACATRVARTCPRRVRCGRPSAPFPAAFPVRASSPRASRSRTRYTINKYILYIQIERNIFELHREITKSIPFAVASLMRLGISNFGGSAHEVLDVLQSKWCSYATRMRTVTERGRERGERESRVESSSERDRETNPHDHEAQPNARKDQSTRTGDHQRPPERRAIRGRGKGNAKSGERNG